MEGRQSGFASVKRGYRKIIEVDDFAIHASF